MIILNTPEEAFADIPDYPFEANYLDIGDGLMMHYVDEGPPNGDVVLLLHGEPSWSYLYRKMIPVFVQSGFRVLAPDLIGFGKSSKPVEQSDYSYALHIDWMSTWLEHLDLQDINLFCQDWGGLIGLRLLAKYPDRFARAVAANTMLPTGDHATPDAFFQWQTYSKTVDILPVGKILQSSSVRTLTKEEVAAYNAPFPDQSYMAGAKIFPSLVPTRPDNVESENNREAWKILAKWEKPFLTLFSDSDPITKGGERPLQKIIPGAKGQAHQIITEAGHFLQEDKGDEIAHLMIQFIQTT